MVTRRLRNARIAQKVSRRFGRKQLSTPADPRLYAFDAWLTTTEFDNHVGFYKKQNKTFKKAFHAWLETLTQSEIEVLMHKTAEQCAAHGLSLAWTICEGACEDEGLQTATAEVALLYALTVWKGQQSRRRAAAYADYVNWQTQALTEQQQAVNTILARLLWGEDGASAEISRLKAEAQRDLLRFADLLAEAKAQFSAERALPARAAKARQQINQLISDSRGHMKMAIERSRPAGKAISNGLRRR